MALLYVVIQKPAKGKNFSHFCHLLTKKKSSSQLVEIQYQLYDRNCNNLDFPQVESCSNEQWVEQLQTSTLTENTIRLQITLQQKKTTKSLDNLSAVKKLELYPTYMEH